MSKPKQQAQRPVCAACDKPIPVCEIARFQGQRYHRAGACIVPVRVRNETRLKQVKAWLRRQNRQRSSLIAEQKALRQLIIRTSSCDLLGWLMLKERAPDLDEAVGVNKILQRKARITVHTHWTDSTEPQHTITHASLT